MSKVYFGKTTDDLKKLRRKKVYQLQKVSEFNTYFARRDRDLLAHQISQIDAVLAARASQLPLL